MARKAWIDRRLDEKFNGLDGTLNHLDRDIREVRTDLREMRTLMFQLWGSTLGGILATIVTVLLTST